MKSYCKLINFLSVFVRMRLQFCCNATGLLFLTKHNTAINQNILYETSTTKRYKMNAAVHSMLPEVCMFEINIHLHLINAVCLWYDMGPNLSNQSSPIKCIFWLYIVFFLDMFQLVFLVSKMSRFCLCSSYFAEGNNWK